MDLALNNLQTKPNQSSELEKHKDTNGNIERPGSTFKLPSTKFDTVLSTSRTKSLIRMKKQCNAQRGAVEYTDCFSAEG